MAETRLADARRDLGALWNRCELWEVSRAVMPFVAMMMVVLFIVTYVPAFSLALVR